MRAEILHQANFTFETKIRNHVLFQDTSEAAGGDNRGPTPKELLIAGVIGCAGMDVVSLLKKKKETADTLVITGDAEPRKEHPRIFESLEVSFTATGSGVKADTLNEAVHLSLTKYCGVTAMVSKVVAVKYRVILNGKQTATGQADFGL